ncbi:hypothetical protein [Robertkochia solimangrovi]|uniref:hypothetical protein n=1 Tax=Robertkochia solimangrovi TaxID=2213046 RepID=UPI00117C8914|nr:hypothetical protein [Robertkochia solimangrovi]TRZ44195.1 hypothetical protein DMZ48_06690 [Robertkochia solimangrovi]
MILNVSYNEPDINRLIDEKVGKSYSLMERLKMGGTGSPPFDINACSTAIYHLLILDNNRNRCNVEIRRNGILIRFRSLLDTFALVIPYYKLAMYKTAPETYSIHIDHHFIRLRAPGKASDKFLRQLLTLKNERQSGYLTSGDLK